MSEYYDNKDEQERVILTSVFERNTSYGMDSLEELKELVKTAGAETVGVLTQNMESANNTTYLGTGKLDELKTMIMAYDLEIENLEKAINDILNLYKKEKLDNRKIEIIEELEQEQDADKKKKLEKELSNIIIELAKIK